MMRPYVYCPYCRTELVSRPIPTDGPVRKVCPACKFIQWGNSKPTASGIVTDEQGRALLVRRGIEPFKGMWDIPGGFLEASEHPEDGVVREIFEETGLRVRPVRLIGVYMDTYGPPPSEDTLNFYYECRVTDDLAPAPADDVTETGWFFPANAPGPLAFENTRQAFADWTART
jgi:ADP-ribose pyrophosphatase YjhB (NUDIX family)